MTSHVVHNLEAEANGYLRVRSVIGTGSDARRSEWSATSTGTTGTAPAPDPLAAPANFESTAPTNDSITLAWDKVANADSYEVEQRLAGAGGNWNAADCGDTGSNVVDGTSCVASGLDEGTSYEFRVRGIPEDDSAYADGDWAEAEGTTEGRTTVTTPGGMGNLNVTWKSDAESITFRWEPMSGVSYEWEVLATFNEAANPCADETFDTADNSGNEFSHPVADLDPGDVRGLCVRIDDDDLDDDEKALSFAWGVVTPAAPTPGAPVDEDGVTESMTWSAINLIRDFEWELRLVEDRGRNDGSITDSSSASDVQKACAAGGHIDDGEADLPLTLSHTVDSGIDHYAGYSLCLKYSNTTGSTDWAVHDDEIYTTPGQSPPPVHQSGRTVTVRNDDGTRESETHTWTVATKDMGTTVPREADEYVAKIVTYPEWIDVSGTRTRTSHPSKGRLQSDR